MFGIANVVLVTLTCLCECFPDIWNEERLMFGLEKEIPDKQCPLTLKEDYKHALVSRSDLYLFAGTRKRRTFPLRGLLSVRINLTFFSCVRYVFAWSLNYKSNANEFLPSNISLEIRELNLTHTALRTPQKLRRRLWLQNWLVWLGNCNTTAPSSLNL